MASFFGSRSRSHWVFDSPMLLSYVYAIYDSGSSIWRKIRLHYLPFLAYFLLITLPNFLSYPTEKPVFEYLVFLNENELIFQIQALYLIFYCLITLTTLASYKKKLKLAFSNHENRDLDWFRYLNLGLAAIISFNIFAAISEAAFNIEFDLSIFTTLLLILLMCFLGYFGMMQSKILIPVHLFQEEVKQPTKKKDIKHHLANADEGEIRILNEKLQLILEHERIYLNPDVTLLSLAKAMDTSDKKLSALINHHLKTTFYDLINHYRIEEVKRRLRNKDHLESTLLAIALDSGFNSKTTFNRIFKNETGCSPSEFTKRHI